jgi:hypothetical protein
VSYDRCVAIYRRLREEHRDNPDLLAIVEQFGHEIAFLRTLDERTAMLQADIACQKASDNSRDGKLP